MTNKNYIRFLITLMVLTLAIAFGPWVAKELRVSNCKRKCDSGYRDDRPLCELKCEVKEMRLSDCIKEICSDSKNAQDEALCAIGCAMIKGDIEK